MYIFYKLKRNMKDNKNESIKFYYYLWKQVWNEEIYISKVYNILLKVKQIIIIIGKIII